MTFEQLCEAVRLYIESIPTEPTRGRDDDWRDRIDNTLADIRATLCTDFDPEDAA